MKVETSCENCYFKAMEWGEKTTQIGCYFNRLDKFKAAGIKVEKKEGQEYYTIDAHCNRCSQTDGKLSSEEYSKLAIEKSRIHCDLLVTPLNEEDLKNYISLFKSLVPQPQKFLVIDTKRNNERFAKLLSTEKFKWQTISGETANWDDAIDRTDSEYFWILDYYDKDVPSDILQKVDDAFNEKMLQPFCITGNPSRYGTVVNYDMYKMFVGGCEDMVNRFKTIDERYELKLGKKVYEWSEI